jgi:nucleotide-binding universal stress UspA family protein
MTTATPLPLEDVDLLVPAAPPTGPLLVASDGAPESDAAVELARALAGQLGAPVRLASVVRPFAMPMYGFDAVPVPLETDAATRAGREAALRAQAARVGVAEGAWPVEVRTGETARELAALATANGARVVITGRGRHGAMARTFGGETVMRLLQVGDTPVYAVEPGHGTLARRVLVAVDFSPFSQYALQVALPLLAPDASVVLVHAGPHFEPTDPVLAARAADYRQEVQAAFGRLRQRVPLGAHPVEERLLEGDAADELLTLVSRERADLLVLATHGRGFWRRLVVGSVAAAMVRHAPCAVLCVPGSARTLAAARARQEAGVTTRRLATTEFDRELDSFTGRNQGRLCTVEVHRADLGAQVLGEGLPLVGAACDRRAEEVELMFGAAALAGRHITHRIARVTEIDLTTDGDGRDQVLRVVHDGGQTLVALH